MPTRLIADTTRIFADCFEAFELLKSDYVPGIYTLRFAANGSADTSGRVFCDADGWTVFQSRGQFGNPLDYFYRGWDAYEEGFGVPGREHWLGLRALATLTRSREYMLR